MAEIPAIKYTFYSMKLYIRRNIHKSISTLMVVTFLTTTMLPPSYAQTVLNLPSPGTMITPSVAFSPAIITGMTIYPENPLQFDFIVDAGDDRLQGETLKKEASKLINYFMATLTVPEDEMWVNLSPYEKNRIIAEGLGKTEMGRDMLAQDYILKQLTASFLYPESKVGQEFWKRVYAKAQEKFGTTEIPTDLFNKVWIVPQEASVYVHNNNVFVTNSHLKVMLEQDYLALESNQGSEKHGLGNVTKDDIKTISGTSAQLIREILLPEIEKEVNEGKNFSNLRQIYNSMILATWYKKKLKHSLLDQIYLNQNKTKGIELKDKNIKERIYKQYLEAFKKGVYNYIKEDYDEQTQEVIPRKYFSGGLARPADVAQDSAMPADLIEKLGQHPTYAYTVAGRLQKDPLNQAMLSDVDIDRLEEEIFDARQKVYQALPDSITRFLRESPKVDPVNFVQGVVEEAVRGVDSQRWDSLTADQRLQVAKSIWEISQRQRSGNQKLNAVVNEISILQISQSSAWREAIHSIMKTINLGQNSFGKTNIIGIFDAHEYEESVTLLEPALDRILEQTQGPVVFIEEGTMGPEAWVEVLLEMEDSGKKRQLLAEFTSFWEGRKDPIPLLDEEIRRYQAGVNQLRDKLASGKAPIEMIQKGYSQKLYELKNRYRKQYPSKIQIVFEPMPRDAFLWRAASLLFAQYAHRYLQMGNKEAYKSLIYSRTYADAKSCLIRDEAIANALNGEQGQDDWRKKYGAGATFVMLRGFVHKGIMKKLKGDHFRTLTAVTVQSLPSFEFPVVWVGQRLLDGDINSPFTAEEREYLMHENPLEETVHSVRSDASVTSIEKEWAAVRKRMRPQYRPGLISSLIQSRTVELPSIDFAMLGDVIKNNVSTDKLADVIKELLREGLLKHPKDKKFRIIWGVSGFDEISFGPASKISFEAQFERVITWLKQEVLNDDVPEARINKYKVILRRSEFNADEYEIAIEEMAGITVKVGRATDIKPWYILDVKYAPKYQMKITKMTDFAYSLVYMKVELMTKGNEEQREVLETFYLIGYLKDWPHEVDQQINNLLFPYEFGVGDKKIFDESKYPKTLDEIKDAFRKLALELEEQHWGIKSPGTASDTFTLTFDQLQNKLSDLLKRAAEFKHNVSQLTYEQIQSLKRESTRKEDGTIAPEVEVEMALTGRTEVGDSGVKDNQRVRLFFGDQEFDSIDIINILREGPYQYDLSPYLKKDQFYEVHMLVTGDIFIKRVISEEQTAVIKSEGQDYEIRVIKKVNTRGIGMTETRVKVYYNGTMKADLEQLHQLTWGAEEAARLIVTRFLDRKTKLSDYRGGITGLIEKLEEVGKRYAEDAAATWSMSEEIGGGWGVPSPDMVGRVKQGAGDKADQWTVSLLQAGDKAMLSNPGGIDFNTSNLNLKEQGQNININFSFDTFQNIQPKAINGILPVIINITPVINFPFLLGLSQEKRQVSRL